MVNVIEYLKNFITAKLNKISINFKFIKHLNGKKYIKGQAFAAPYQSFKIILLRPILKLQYLVENFVAHVCMYYTRTKSRHFQASVPQSSRTSDVNFILRI